MSGICALLRTDQTVSTAPVLRAIAEGLTLTANSRVTALADHCGGVAVCARFDTQQTWQNTELSIACEAELYNETELRGLVPNEFSAGDSSIAALLAGLYRRFGTDLFAKLRGRFGVVLWDRIERRLIAAVDHFGVNRLVYCSASGGIAVASRIDALSTAGLHDREINPRALANVLNFSASLAPETIFKNVHRLLPGTVLVASAAGTHIERYWDMVYGLPGDKSEAGLSKGLKAVFEESVLAHCKDDSFEGIGAFLSGGTDSSTIVGLMAGMQKGPVNTFSIGFEEQQFNELGYAEIAAKRFGTRHHTYLVSAQDCFEAVPHMVRSFDEPFGNSSAIPTYFCARLAAEHGVGALLAGDGGDELFGGNEWYASDRIFQLYQNVPGWLRDGVIEPILSRGPVESGLIAKARSYVRRAKLPGLERILSYHFLNAHAPAGVFSSDFLRTLGDYSVMDVPARYYSAASAQDDLDRMLYVDVKITIGDSDLPKVTRMAELAGVQVRFPFLDPSVARFSGQIPANLKVKGFQKRYLFKRALRDLLPDEILKKKKHGFGIPVSTWLKSDRKMRELLHDTLQSSRAFERGYFQRTFVDDLFRKHADDNSSYYGDTLWTFLVLELWHKQFVDAPMSAVVV